MRRAPAHLRLRPATLRLAWPIALLAAVLGLLGGLQYRWLSQVSRAERERLARDAQHRAEAIAQDFDREVTRAYVLLQVPPEPRPPGAAETFADRWDRWTSRAPHPGMVHAVYLVERHDGAAALTKFEPGRRGFVPAGWPDVLRPLRDRMQGAEAGGLPPMPVLADVPAVISPVPDILALEDGGPAPPGQKRVLLGANFQRILAHRATGRWPARGYTVVVFDRAYLTGRLLPELATRHVQGAQSPDYDVTVVDPAAQVLWASASPRPGGDAAAPALQVRFDDLERSLLDTADLAGAPPDHFRVRIAAGVVGKGPSDVPPPAWRVVVAHRAGSVEALVTALRRRNLAVGFGILGVLAAAVVLVVVSAQRARTLAERQIEFVAGVSHELRTPVAVIRSAAENLADGVVTEAAQVRRYGSVIVDHAARLGSMVEQVLTLAGARPRARAAQRVVPGALVQAAVEDHASDLRAAGMPLDVEVEPGLPDLAGDPDALRRALANLVANARRHAEGSPVRVRARRGPGGGVAIDVEDQGPGIAPEDLPHVFEPFYRGRRATEDQVPGSGLGLAVVRGVTEAHGGRVSVRSGAGDGTTFTLHLPASTPP